MKETNNLKVQAKRRTSNCLYPQNHNAWMAPDIENQEGKLDKKKIIITLEMKQI